MDQKGNPNERIMRRVVGSTMFVTSAILCYFFGRYWLKNPDAIMPNGEELYCWSTNHKVEPGNENWRIYNEYGPKDPLILIKWTNVTESFMHWFRMGFFLQIIGMFLWLFFGLANCIPSANEVAINYCTTCCSMCQVCGIIIWFIYGMVERWKPSGIICSGRLRRMEPKPSLEVRGIMRKSGTFIKVWMLTFYAFICCCCLVSGIYVCANKKQ